MASPTLKSWTSEMQEFVDTEGAHGLATSVINTPGISFREYQPGYFLDYHTAPRRQYSITLTGEIELGTPDGTVKHCGPGSVLLAEDLTWAGHFTRVVGDPTALLHHRSAGGLGYPLLGGSRHDAS